MTWSGSWFWNWFGGWFGGGGPSVPVVAGQVNHARLVDNAGYAAMVAGPRVTIVDNSAAALLLEPEDV